ncbi:MAG: hypothetical protein N2Z80_04325 [Hydrogenothermaceae bacterium]|nr:hypothetical protein [Hydrogenothermaceae bacterium]
MKVESHIKGRIRLRLELSSERRDVKILLDKLDGVEEVRESALSILVKYRPGSEAEAFFRLLDREVPKEKVKLKLDDIYHYTVPLIKSSVTKALYSVFLLGFKRGLITFGICSLLLARYLKTKF